MLFLGNILLLIYSLIFILSGENMLAMLKKLWSNPTHRNRLILVVLVLVLLIVIIFQLVNRPVPPPEGALRGVICRKCGDCYATRIKDIRNSHDLRNKCRKCGGRLAIAWKCNECQFEYSKINDSPRTRKKLKTMEKLRSVALSTRCPNCGSLATHPIAVDELKKTKK